MKKILFIAAAVAVVSLASCGKGEKGEAVDSDTIVAVETIVTEAVDTATNDTVVAAATEAVEAVVPATEQK